MIGVIHVSEEVCLAGGAHSGLVLHAMDLVGVILKSTHGMKATVAEVAGKQLIFPSHFPLSLAFSHLLTLRIVRGLRKWEKEVVWGLRKWGFSYLIMLCLYSRKNEGGALF